MEVDSEVRLSPVLSGQNPILGRNCWGLVAGSRLRTWKAMLKSEYRYYSCCRSTPGCFGRSVALAERKDWVVQRLLR